MTRSSPINRSHVLRASIAVLIILMAFSLQPLSNSASYSAFGNVSASRPAFNSLTGREAINYTWAGPQNGNVTAVIVDGRGTVSRSIDAGPQKTGRNNVTWDGKDGGGSPAIEGGYTVWLLYRPGGLVFSYRQPFTLPPGVDNASVNVTVDNTPPVTGVTIPGSRDASGNYTTPVEASLPATDVLSGINATEYSLDGAPWARYAGAIEVGEGAHSLRYRSIDRAGNIEAAKAKAVNVSAPGAPAPAVTSIYPENGDGDQPLDSIITAWFSNDMDANTINADTFRLVADGGDQVSGIVEYDISATLIPESELSPDTRYTVMIKGTVADTNGTRMGEDYSWSFTTGDDGTDMQLSEGMDGSSPNESAYDTGVEALPANESAENATMDEASSNNTPGDPGALPSVPDASLQTPDPQANVSGQAAPRVSPTASPGELAAFVIAGSFLAMAYREKRRKK